ncbi:benzyl alcohol O-benzoyltransferase-like [Vigna unguiculata]|uniref:Shikimate O-hydroxycinnamoyltransferase n=1 Tax=Vigna unguiculata TaxID=3917 RepID=A0A4D6KIG4_VIGUN|nr:benzyl alcohol O-benzoyltransferase-like [Vigna unguiculata]QCD77676.1 shikimate O-hydroxycinnamoyltransferase [Vigna unguiculata]
MASSSPSPPFTMHKCKPELVAPSIPTPDETKLLSEIDDQNYLRFHYSIIQIYQNESSMANKDPVRVIRQALAQALVFYYPFAGRLREGRAHKLMVDCTGEGVMFVEADADVTLDQFGDNLQPPFIHSKSFMCDVAESEDIKNLPLLLIQVTRLKCGGFVVSTGWNHVMADGAGLSQFMQAWAEMARGIKTPSISPLWRRELLMARDPPRITCNHREYDQIQDNLSSSDLDLVHRSFFFGPTQMAALRGSLPRELRQCTAFDLITACFWRCRTRALQIDPNEDVRMMCIVNARNRFRPPLPVGYYGNAFAYPAAMATAGKLCANPYAYAVELIHNVKGAVTEEYMHSVADLMVLKGRCMPTTVRSCLVSDLTRARFRDVDFGWGKALSGAPAKGSTGPFYGGTHIVSYKNSNGVDGLVLPVWMPAKAMPMFVKEMEDLMSGNQKQLNHPTKTAAFIRSTM